MPQKPCHQNHDLNTLPQQGQSHALCKRAARIRCGKEVYQKQTEIMNKLVSIKSTRGSERSTGYVDEVCFWGIATPVTQERDPTMPESAHQQWGGSPHRTEHWLFVAEGNCVAERRGGEQPEANDQSIIKNMMNSRIFHEKSGLASWRLRRVGVPNSFTDLASDSNKVCQGRVAVVPHVRGAVAITGRRLGKWYETDAGRN